MHFGTDKSAQQKKVVILNESTSECSFICCVFLVVSRSFPEEENVRNVERRTEAMVASKC